VDCAKVKVWNLCEVTLSVRPNGREQQEVIENMPAI
jgi:hypothetical protein